MNKIDREEKTVSVMVELYCQGHHGKKQGLCADCAALLDYSLSRLNNCKFGNKKPACVKCKIHCYNEEHRKKIRAIMRYSGPRIFFRHPILTIRHLVS
jgi:hypothetical protein